ncbi:MAG: 50S ribosomal protein L3 [Deltaproteobacteria bacterium]|nr:50S ribosomal protein L3 [Deltaproteobacteria bacterium]
MAKICEKGLIVSKVGMTRMVDTEGRVIPVTLLKVEDQRVTKLLTPERDGYYGYQVGYAPGAEKNLTKADISRLRKVEVEGNYSKFIEFRTSAATDSEIGRAMTAELFQGVGAVDVTGVTRGRGFQGAVKRWGSRIGRKSHGSRFHRRPGSLGQNTSPGRVFKNKHQPGQMGVAMRTVRNIRVMDVDTVNNVIAVKGSVPGHKEGFLEIRPTNKAGKVNREPQG